MGSVFAARNLATGKRVALKWVLAERSSDAEVLQRFQREARAAGRIDHPNVVSVYDVGQHGPSTFLVMELLHGQPISRLMKQGPLPANVAVDLLMPALRGIAAAHAQGVIHRDLKPDNIFLCMAPDGTPRETKVLDFGISKMTDEVREGLSVTRTGAVVGTPYYMSPEQVRGMRDLDVRLDVYAMGVILYEMLARRPPFMAESYSALVVEIATGAAPSLQTLRPDLDSKLIAVIETAMARERENRYPDIESLAVALEPFGGGRRFRERPDWTDKFLLPNGLPALSPGLDATDPDVDDDNRISRQQTISSEEVLLDEAESTTVASGRLDIEVPEQAPASLVPDVEPVATHARGSVPESDPPSIARPAPLAGRGTLIAGVVIGIGLAVAVIVMLSIGDDPDATRSAVAPPPASAVAPNEGSAGAAEVDEEDSREGVRAEDESATATEEVVATSGAELEGEASAPAASERGDEAGGESEARTPRTSARADRRARPRARRAETASDAESEPAMAAETTSRGMNRPRAGSISLDDF